MLRSVLKPAPCASGPVQIRQRLGVRATLSSGRVTATVGASCGCRASCAHQTAFFGRSTAAGLPSGCVQQSSRAAPTGRASKRSFSRVTARAGDGPDAVDRVAGAVPYLVPLFDSLKYGKFAMAQVPVIRQILAPLSPLIQLYFGFPFSSLIFFFGIYLGIVQNSRFGRFARFNGMQAVLLDIILIFPSLFERILQPPSGGFGLTIFINVYNTIFYFVLISVAYAVGSCFAGQVARLPIVADAADAQVP